MQKFVPAALMLAAGAASAASADVVVIQPVATPSYSTYRSCVPTDNTYNGNGLSDASLVSTGSPVPAAWPTHGTDGCNNMWHTSCLNQSGSTCEGGPTADLTPFIVYDLGTTWDLSSIHLWNHNQMPPGTGNETDRGIQSMEITVSTDGVNYSSAIPYNSVSRAPGSTSYAGDDYALVAQNVRYVRIQVLQNWGSTGVTGLSEIRFTGTGRLAFAGASASPSTVEMCGPQSAVISARVISGATAHGAVTISGGPLAGGTVMNDDGVDGDAVAGDGIYSVTANFPADYPIGDAVFTLSTADGDNTATANATVSVGICIPTYTENGDADQMPETAAVASGHGELDRIRGSLTTDDIDMYKITICDPSNFSATIIGGSTVDTQMFLFSEDGHAVAFNDDSPSGSSQSTITGGVSAAGIYYIAVTGWDKDPVNANGSELFLDTPYNTQHSPDGAGAADPIAGWNGTYFVGTGDYLVTLTGTCFVEAAPPACPADLGIAGGQAGQDGLLDNNDFIAFITYFFNQDSHADLGVAGGLPGHDGFYDNNDFIAFINYFFAGCN